MVRYIIHISFGYLLDLYVKTVAARFSTFPHCDTDDRSQLQLSAILSVPHSFEALNPNSDAISLSRLEIVSASIRSDINPRFLLTLDSLEGIVVRRSLHIYTTLRIIIVKQSITLITMWHRFIILQGKPN